MALSMVVGRFCIWSLLFVWLGTPGVWAAYLGFQVEAAADGGSVGGDTCKICAHENLNALARGDVKSVVRREVGSNVGTSDGNSYLILTFGDAELYHLDGKFSTNVLSWGCYGNRWNVPVRAVDPKDVKGCTHYQKDEQLVKNMWFFARLCAMGAVLGAFQEIGDNGLSRGAMDLELHRDPEWVFHLDGDTAVFNADLPLSELAREWSSKDLVFYERFRSGEVAAGNYAARVSQPSLDFIQQWERWASKASFYFSNWDNGALHIQLVSYLQSELQATDPSATNMSSILANLERVWHMSSDVPQYDVFVAAAKLALGPRRDFQNVLILRRGQGFCEDEDMADGGLSIARLAGGPAERYLCLHGLRDRVRHFIQVVGQDCVTAVEQCGSSLMKCKKHAAEPSSLKAFVESHPVGRIGLGRFNDVGACWPSCSRDLSEETWDRLKPGLQRNAACQRATWPLSCCCDA